MEKQIEELIETAKIAWTKNSNHELMTFEECNELLRTILQIQQIKDKK